MVGRRTRRKDVEVDLQDQLSRLSERVLALEEEVKTLKTTNAGLHEIVEAKEAVDDIEFLLTKNEELTGRDRQTFEDFEMTFKITALKSLYVDP